jgi:Anthrone oxygenase
MAVLMISAAVIGLLTTFVLFRRRSTTAGWLALAGLLLIVAVIVLTLAVEVPIDNKIKTWTVATLPSGWQDIRARWAAFHTLRAFLSLAAVAATVGAALTTRPAAGTTLPPAGEQREPSSLHGRQRGEAGWGDGLPSAGDGHGAQEFTESTRSGKD